MRRIIIIIWVIWPNRLFFRFDVKVNGNYRAAFEYIRNELIYRFPEKEGYNKLFAVMELIKHTSQIRSITFSLINSLVTEKYYGCFPFTAPDSSTEGQNMYRGKVYDHIIRRCEARLKPTEVSESGKKSKNVYFINREIRKANAIMYYAYTFFMNLPTKDYFAEMKAIFDDQEDIAGVILSDAFRLERDRLIEKIYNIEQCLSFDANEVIDKYSNDIYALICIDENMTSAQERVYCKRHIEHMITLVELCKKLIFRQKEIRMPLIIILEVMYLYIRLKRSKTVIKTTSVGYTKEQVSRPVQIDTAMKNIREEWDNPDDKSVSYDLYMKNIMVETWLTGVLYMIINNMDVHLFKQMLMASEKLFLALTQLVPSISIKSKQSAMEDELQTPENFLNNIYNWVNDSLWDLVVDEQPDEDDLLADKILNELLWD